jgi:digeranylgeranylglycerophospholipid reductase
VKILVVGAGPAGLSAALNASREGNDVTVFEKYDKVGQKVCAEALAREALEYVDSKPSEEFVANKVKGFQITFKGKFIREAAFGNLPNVPGYLIDKTKFLSLLQSKAEENGTNILFKKMVTEVDPASGRIKLENGRTMQGDLIICADGAGSLSKRHLDYSNYEIAPCMQYQCVFPEGEFASEYLHLDITGAGYLWVFPKKDHANVGAGSPQANSVNSFAYLRRFIEEHRGTIIGQPRSAPVSVGGPVKHFSIGKLVVAGEAAGCVMPLSGEGNRFALYAGSIAYKPNYKQNFMKKYGKNMKISRKILKLVKELNDKERTDLLSHMKDPLKVLEGNWPELTDFILNPKLLMKLISTSLLS